MKDLSRKEKIQQRTITRQVNELEKLKQMLSDLEVSNEKKDELIDSVNDLRDEFIGTIENLKKQKREYNSLIDEVKCMRDAMNANVFRGRWRIIKWLMR